MQQTASESDVATSRSWSSSLSSSLSRSRSSSEVLENWQLDGNVHTSSSSSLASSFLLPPPPPPPTRTGSDFSRSEGSPGLSTPLHFDFTSSDSSGGSRSSSSESESDRSWIGGGGMSYSATWAGREGGIISTYRGAAQLARPGAASNRRPDYIQNYHQQFIGNGTGSERPDINGYEYEDEDSFGYEQDANAEATLLGANEQEVLRLRGRQRRLTYELEVSTALNRRLLLQNRALRAGIDGQAEPRRLVRWAVAAYRVVRRISRNWMRILLWLVSVILMLVLASRWYYREDIVYMDRMRREMYGLSQRDAGWKWLWPWS